MLGFLEPTHVALLLIVALLVLGPKRLPEVSKTLGKGLKDFREAMSGYSPESLLHPDEVHAATAAESDVQREAPVAAGTAQSAPNEPTVSAASVDEAAADESTVAEPAEQPAA